MHFNADAYVTNAAPPSIKLGGRLYVGRILSFEEWIPLQEMLIALRRRVKQVAGLTDPALAAQESWLAQLQTRRACRILVDAMFPRSRWYRVWEPRVSALLAREPQDKQLAALDHFMRSQATSLGLEESTPTPATMTTS